MENLLHAYTIRLLHVECLRAGELAKDCVPFLLVKKEKTYKVNIELTYMVYTILHGEGGMGAPS